MKKRKKLFSEIITCKNIILAFREASRLKSFRASVLFFEKNLSTNLLKIIRELQNESYHHGSYKTFKVFEPKERTISAAPFRDRVIHHAVCQIVEPVFDQKFIFDSFANRNNKGTHRALRRLQFFLRKITRERGGG